MGKQWFTGTREFTDEDILATAKAFHRYIRNKGIKWNKSDKQSAQHLVTLVRGFMLGHDNPAKIPKELHIGPVDSSLVALTHSLNQVNTHQMDPVAFAQLYLYANQDDPIQFPLQPGSSNPAIFDLSRINLEFALAKPKHSSQPSPQPEPAEVVFEGVSSVPAAQEWYIQAAKDAEMGRTQAVEHRESTTNHITNLIIALLVGTVVGFGIGKMYGRSQVREAIGLTEEQLDIVLNAKEHLKHK